MLAAAPTQHALNTFWNKLKWEFKIRTMGTPTLFLGMEVRYVQQQGLITLSQQSYILQVAERFSLPSHERAVTPIKTDYYARLYASKDEPVMMDVPYKELVGCLIYIMVCTRPDVAFAVSCLTSNFSNPKQVHWETAVRCLGYLVSTNSFGLSYTGTR